MSAITGIGDCSTIVFSASMSFSRGTATRTMSAPAAATVWICSIVAARFAVSVLVIVCTATGAPPPIGTPPTWIWRSEAMRPVYLDVGMGEHAPVGAPEVYRTARGPLPRLVEPLARRARARRHARFLELVAPGPATRIVDIGCGELGLRGLAP